MPLNSYQCILRCMVGDDTHEQAKDSSKDSALPCAVSYREERMFVHI